MEGMKKREESRMMTECLAQAADRLELPFPELGNCGWRRFAVVRSGVGGGHVRDMSLSWEEGLGLRREYGS